MLSERAYFKWGRPLVFIKIPRPSDITFSLKFGDV